MTRPCVLCGFDLSPVEIQCCQVCVGLVRLDLTQIRVCYELLPSVLGRPAAASLEAVLGAGGGGAQLPGRDVLPMMSSGSAATSWSDGQGGGPSGHPSDPPAVAFELWTWQQDWAEIRGERAHDHQSERDPGVLVHPGAAGRSVAAGRASGGHSVAGLVAWLRTRLQWCMNYHPAADEFARDMGRIRVRLEAATAMSGRPQYGAHCLDCTDVRLARRYGSEVWSCPRCRRDYDGSALWLAVRADMEADRARGSMWVTLLEAARAAGRPHRTLRSWVHAGVVSGACRIEDGAALVWLPDVMDATAAAHRRVREALTEAATGR